MNSDQYYRTTGIVLYWVAFLCLAFIIENNIQNIVEEQRLQRALLGWEKKNQARQDSERAAREDKDPSETSGSSKGDSSGPDPEPPADIGTDADKPSEILPGGFRQIDEEEAGVTFHVPKSWTRAPSTNDRGNNYLVYESPDNEVRMVLLCKPDPENTFIAATESTLRTLVEQNYVPLQTRIGGEKCRRWVYQDLKALNIERVFRHDGKGYSLVFWILTGRFSKWETTLDQVRTSFRFKELPHGE